MYLKLSLAHSGGGGWLVVVVVLVVAVVAIVAICCLICYSVYRMSYTFQTSDVSVDEIPFHCVPNRKMFQTIFPAIWLKGLSCRNCFDSSVVALARELETR